MNVFIKFMVIFMIWGLTVRFAAAYPGTSFGVVTPDNFESFLSPSSFCNTPNERTMP